MTGKQVQGPWMAEGHYIAASEKGLRAAGISSRSNGEIIAECRPSISGLLTKEQKEAIARLMAAAPDLLEACKKAVRELNEIRARDGVPYTHQGIRASVCPDYFSSVVDECFSAIEKATSEGQAHA